MEGGGVLFIIVLLVLLVWVIVTYNVLVRLRLHTKESWSGVDTELKRRYDLIPSLVEVVKGYAKHEEETFRRIAEARQRAMAAANGPAAKAQEERALVGGLTQLMAVVENYPELKASNHFLRLQAELVNTEDRIQAARRFFNANVRDLNTRIEVFPSNVIASLFGFKREDHFEVGSATVREMPKIDLAPSPPVAPPSSSSAKESGK